MVLFERLIKMDLFERLIKMVLFERLIGMILFERSNDENNVSVAASYGLIVMRHCTHSDVFTASGFSFLSRYVNYRLHYPL